MIFCNNTGTHCENLMKSNLIHHTLKFSKILFKSEQPVAQPVRRYKHNSFYEPWTKVYDTYCI